MNRRVHKGYTLVEVLVAMVILGLVLPGLATMVINARKTQNSSLRLDNAVAAGQQVLDEMSIKPKASVPVDGSQTVATDGVNYTVSWKITNTGATTSSGRKVALTVYWEQAGNKHSTNLFGALP